MSKAVWALQIIVALAFLAAGTMKSITPKEQLVANGMGWAQDFSSTLVKLIAAAEVAGAIGLIVPAATGIAPILTPIAGAGLALLMAGAMATHLQRGEPPFPPLVLGLLAAAAAILTLRLVRRRRLLTV